MRLSTAPAVRRTRGAATESTGAAIASPATRPAVMRRRFTDPPPTSHASARPVRPGSLRPRSTWLLATANAPGAPHVRHVRPSLPNELDMILIDHSVAWVAVDR